MSDCRYVEGYGYFKKSHVRSCRARDCRGCEPCEHDENGRPVRHCTARRFCSGHLTDSERLTCARCVGKTRQDIAKIVDDATLMSTEALEQGVDSEAAYLAGPATDPEAWMWRKVTAKRRGLPVLEDDDPHHPFLVLGRWDFMLREAYDQPTDTVVALSRSAAYLTGLLTTLAQDPDQDWPLFVGEIADCRAYLESVRHDSRTPELGAPCPECSTREKPGPALVKRYGSRIARIDGEPTVIGDTTGASDTWRCPRVREHEWSEADYRLRIGDEHLEHADELPVRDLAVRTGVAAGTIRRWANVTRRVTRDGVVELPARLKPSGRSHDGRKLYRVADVEALRDGDTEEAS